MIRSRLLPSVFGLSILIIFSGLPASAQNFRSSISGFVFDMDRRPISQVIVELRSDFSTVGRTKTDGSGRFYFTGLALGRYSIRVMPLGTPYQEATEEVELAGMGSRGQALSDHQQKDVYLRRRKSPGPESTTTGVIFAQEVPPEAAALYKSAVSDLESERKDEGIEDLQRAIDLFPKYFMALHRMGMELLGQKQFERAAETFEKAIGVNERCFDCWYGLAYAKYTLRKFPEAVTAGQKAVAERAGSVEANLVLGMSYRMTKDFPKAESALKQAAKSADGASPDVHWQLALLYGKDLERFSDAAKELEAYLKLEPEAPNKETIKKLIRQFKDRSKVQNFT